MIMLDFQTVQENLKLVALKDLDMKHQVYQLVKNLFQLVPQLGLMVKHALLVLSLLQMYRLEVP